jgi:hypothetical protein
MEHMRHSREFTVALLRATYECLLVILPVGFYVGLEAIHRHDRLFLLSSPEWSIATVFLSFQGVALYRSNLRRTGKPLQEDTFDFLQMLVLIITLSAAIVAYLSLEHGSGWLLFFQSTLLVMAGVGFLLLVGSSEYMHRTSIEVSDGGT